MAEGKKSFILYTDIIDAFEHLTNEQRGVVFWWILQYVNDRNPEPLNGLLMAVISTIRSQLKRDLNKYKVKLEQSSESGRIGNLKRWNTDLYNDYVKGVYTLDQAETIAKYRKVSPPDENTSPPDPTPSHPIAKIADSVNVNVNDTVNNKKDGTTAKAIDFENLLLFINKTFGRSYQAINPAVQAKYKARLKEGYTSENIRVAMLNCKKDPHHIETNYKYCTPEFFSRADKIDLHSNRGKPDQSSDPLVNYVNKHIEQYGHS